MTAPGSPSNGHLYVCCTCYCVFITQHHCSGYLPTCQKQQHPHHHWLYCRSTHNGGACPGFGCSPGLAAADCQAAGPCCHFVAHLCPSSCLQHTAFPSHTQVSCCHQLMHRRFALRSGTLFHTSKLELHLLGLKPYTAVLRGSSSIWQWPFTISIASDSLLFSQRSASVAFPESSAQRVTVRPPCADGLCACLLT